MFIKYSHQAFPSHISFWFICVNFILPFYFYLAHLSTKLEPISTAIDRKLYVGRNQNFIFYGSSSKFLKIYFFFLSYNNQTEMETKTLIQLTKYWLKTNFLFEREILFPGWLEVFTKHIPLLVTSLQYEVVKNHNKWVLLSVPKFS